MRVNMVDKSNGELIKGVRAEIAALRLYEGGLFEHTDDALNTLLAGNVIESAFIRYEPVTSNLRN